MSYPIVIVRGEPGASATAAKVVAAGEEAVVAPLFAACPLAWDAPDAEDFDALLLTSANAVRHGGDGLALYHGLPCWCVGVATGSVAKAAGFSVVRVGDSDAATLLAAPEAEGQRWLWLAGARHQPLAAPPSATLTVRTVYAVDRLPVAAGLRQALAGPTILLVHSSEAARVLRGLVTNPAIHQMVAISADAAKAAGSGWRSVSSADSPNDSEMVAIAAALCQKARHE